jgi:hypothetical protein
LQRYPMSSHDSTSFSYGKGLPVVQHNYWSKYER